MKAFIFQLSLLFSFSFFLSGCDDVGDYTWGGGYVTNYSQNDQFNVIQGSPIRENVMDNDVIYSSTIGKIAWSDEFTANGFKIIMAGNGYFAYEPPISFFGQDSFQYNIEGSDRPAQVNLTIIKKEDAGVFTDPRDNQEYGWIRLSDGQHWMAQNLNFTKDQSWWYDDDLLNGEKFGRLYTWEAANNACPKGWRLPTKEEVDEVLIIDKGSLQAYKTHYLGGSSGFNALPGGMRMSDGKFVRLDEYGKYWTSTTDDEEDTGYSYGFSHSVGVRPVLGTFSSKEDGYSCRCVKKSK